MEIQRVVWGLVALLVVAVGMQVASVLAGGSGPPYEFFWAGAWTCNRGIQSGLDFDVKTSPNSNLVATLETSDPSRVPTLELSGKVTGSLFSGRVTHNQPFPDRLPPNRPRPMSFRLVLTDDRSKIVGTDERGDSGSEFTGWECAPASGSPTQPPEPSWVRFANGTLGKVIAILVSLLGVVLATFVKHELSQKAKSHVAAEDSNPGENDVPA